MQQVLDSNPQLAQVFNDPETIRQAMRMVSNPNLMREAMRNQDRQLSNIEAL